MSSRWIAALVAVFGLLLTGCGTRTDAVGAPAAVQAQSTPAAVATAPPHGTLDVKACVEVTGANLDLAVASTGEDAKAAADVLGKYTPPVSVREAIDHFVATEGQQFDDPDFDDLNDRIDNWVKKVCPH